MTNGTSLQMIAYFDESGHFDDPNLHFTGMSGFVAPARVWREVEVRWAAVLARYSIMGPFHMREFAHGIGQYEDWSRSRKDELYRALIATLVAAELIPTGCVVSNGAFNSLKQAQQRLLRSPYFTALQECIRGATTQVLMFEPETVDMVFAEQIEHGTLRARGEEHAANAGRTERLYYEIKNSLPLLGQYMGKYGCGRPADTIPLQAADVLVYEMVKDYENLVTSKRAMRRSYRELMRKTGTHPLVKYLDRLMLLSILQESGYVDSDVIAEVDSLSIQQVFLRHLGRHILNERRAENSEDRQPPSWVREEIERRIKLEGHNI
jgi:hypothetical protein